MRLRNPLLSTFLVLAIAATFRVAALEDLVLRGKPFQLEMLVRWSMMTLMLSGPYLVLLFRIHRRAQLPFVSSVSAVIGFSCLFYWLGWLPFQKPVQFGEAHFEVPVALCLQWLGYAVVVLTAKKEANHREESLR
jgi:ABC-type uncharacterized transport system permease subunit